MKLDIEAQLLGKCLVSPDAVAEVTAILHRPDIFQLPDYRRVYQAILSLQTKCYEVDLISVNNELLSQFGSRPGAKDEYTNNWLDVLVDLSSQQSYFAGSVTHACYALIQQSLIEDLNRLLMNGIRELQFVDADPFKVMDTLTGKFADRQSRLLALQEEPFSRTLTEVVLTAERAAMSGNPIMGIASGLARLDTYTKGFQPATLVILAARPGVGKTAVAVQIAYNVAVLGEVPVAYFSLEVTAKQLARRFLGIDAGYKSAQIKSGLYSDGRRIDIARLATSAGKVGSAPLWVYDKVYQLAHLVSKIRQVVREHGVQLVFIDQVSLIKSEHKEKRNQISAASGELKRLANDLNICIVLLAQINREAAKGTNPRPKMDQLKESGSLEEDADTVLLLFRPALHNLKNDADMSYEESLMELSIPKNRDGSAHNDGEAEDLWCDLSTNRVRDFQPSF